MPPHETEPPSIQGWLRVWYFQQKAHSTEVELMAAVACYNDSGQLDVKCLVNTLALWSHLCRLGTIYLCTLEELWAEIVSCIIRENHHWGKTIYKSGHILCTLNLPPSVPWLLPLHRQHRPQLSPSEYGAFEKSWC